MQNEKDMFMKSLSDSIDKIMQSNFKTILEKETIELDLIKNGYNIEVSLIPLAIAGIKKYNLQNYFKERYVVLTDLVKLKEHTCLFSATVVKEEGIREYKLKLETINPEDRKVSQKNIEKIKVNMFKSLENVANMIIGDKYFNIFFADLTEVKTVRLKLRKNNK